MLKKVIAGVKSPNPKRCHQGKFLFVTEKMDDYYTY